MDEFTFRDLGKVFWGATLKLAAARGFFTGLVLVVLILATGGLNAVGATGTLAAMPFAWGAMAPIFGIGIWLFLTALGFLPGTWLLLQISSLAMCLGDPIVYVLNRTFPALFDISDFGLFNFNPIIFITHPE